MICTMLDINHGVLFILGIGIFGGLLGAWFFQKIKFPQVVGYIVIGLIVGESGFHLVNHGDIKAFQPFNFFALGIIGFLVGGELKLEIFRKYAKQFTAILFGEGLGAFVLVGAGVSFFLYVIFKNTSVALAGGVVFGAIASATDPASTIDVLWEYRSKGVLTTSLVAIVALDDALAMTLYGLGTSVAQMLTSDSGSIMMEMGKVSFELFGAIILGGVCALILTFLLRWIHHQPERSLAFAIGLILLLISLSVYLKLDVILAAMTLGFVLTNLVPRRSERLFGVMRSFSIPIYVLFFVLVGARLGLSQMPGWLWGVVGIYVAGRSLGKMAGAYVGARATGSEPVVRRYLGMGLFAQGGVAIGLSIMASQRLTGIMVEEGLSLGDVIIFGVTATTLIAQLAGPPMVKLAIKLAGETGRDVTSDDVINSWSVNDVMDKDFVAIRENNTLAQALRIFTENDYVVYPVINKENILVGVISLEGLKHVLYDRDSWGWLLASDAMVSAKDKAYSHSSLRETLDLMDELKIDQMPVVEKGNDGNVIGMLDISRVRMRISQELINRQQPLQTANC